MSESLAVTAIGLVTSLGYSADASCAGARAGLSLAGSSAGCASQTRRPEISSRWRATTSAV
jgi:hypothetical protein